MEGEAASQKLEREGFPLLFLPSQKRDIKTKSEAAQWRTSPLFGWLPAKGKEREERRELAGNGGREGGKEGRIQASKQNTEEWRQAEEEEDGRLGLT